MAISFTMNYIKPLFVFLLGGILLSLSNSFALLFLINLITQLVLFGLVVCWPIWRTQRLSYVDIGWPFGLVCIGVITLLLGQGQVWKVRSIGCIYLFIGFRMGIGALQLWWKGYMRKEFPRYQYQRRRWERAGKTNLQLAMQVDALVQGLANATFLALPAFIIGSNPSSTFSWIEIVGFSLWALSLALESIADAQKLRFLRKKAAQGEKNQVCELGLWKYSRHPNYFFEWMVWNGLLIASIPSWLLLKNKEPLALWIALGVGLLYVSRLMYLSLVYLTGAVPSEYYSLQKRPAYKAYTQRVNRFFPGKPKK